MDIVFKDKKGRVVKRSNSNIVPETYDKVKIDSKNYICISKNSTKDSKSGKHVVYITVEKLRGRMAKDEELVFVTKKGEDIVCKECKFVEIGNYIFEDMTRSVVCTRYNQFLGFTNKDCEIVEVKGILQCEKNPAVKVVKEQKKKSWSEGGGYGKSGVKNIHWHTSCRKWKVRYYNPITKKHIMLGNYANLDEAKRVLDEHIKSIGAESHI